MTELTMCKALSKLAYMVFTIRQKSISKNESTKLRQTQKRRTFAVTKVMQALCEMNDSLSYSVAVIADIHGNVAALNAVIEDLQSQPYDRLVVAGDLVLNGPRPVESLDTIRNLGAPTIYGTQTCWSLMNSIPRKDWIG